MTLVNDEVPVLVPGLKSVLVCAEGQEVLITIEYICATDPDSDDSTLMYMIARQPYHGVVQRNGIIVDRFIQADVTAGFVSYRHTGKIRTIVLVLILIMFLFHLISNHILKIKNILAYFQNKYRCLKIIHLSVN